MQNNLLDGIFSRQEVLVSCSSIQSLDSGAFTFRKDDISYRASDQFIDTLFANIKNDISNSATRVFESTKAQYPHADKVELVTQILLNRRYRRGKRSDNNPEMIREKVALRVSKNLPVELTISLFPCKIPNRLKAAGNLPDIAEVASVSRLAEIGLAVSRVYSPGAKVIVLMDGHRFKDVLDFDNKIMDDYIKQMKKFVKFLKIGKYIELIDYVSFLENNLPESKIIEKRKTYQKLLKEYSSIVGRKLPVSNPKEYIETLQINHADSDLVQKIIQLYFALIYCNYYPDIASSDNPDYISQKVFSDIFNFSDSDNEVNRLRRKVVARTWTVTRGYVAEIASGRVAKPVEIVFPESIRCDMHNITDRLTLYSVDRSTPLTAFHGTGFIDSKLRVGVRFRVSLQAEGYIPVYGKLLGVDYKDQPIFYFPFTETFDSLLPDEIASSVHLR